MKLGCILGLLALCAMVFAFQQEPPPAAPKPDAFFAGTVVEFTPEKISVSRPVSGKKEQRSFRVTPDTKIEGKVRAKVRVTVRYTTDEDGDIATLIIARPATKK